ncbi:MAG: hypothetical protein ACOYOA_13695 [Saprospiraceae bacterium]
MKTLFNFPLSDPYSVAPLNTIFIHQNSGPTPATTNAAVLNVGGANSIADWVFMELRTGTSGATTVQYTRAALVQADGVIVDIDGVSPFAFPNAVAGNYFISIRHRNHTGFRTANTDTVNSSTTFLNFTDNSIPLNGSFPLKTLTPTVSVMNSGDSNSDGSVDSLDPILWELQNGLFDDYLLNADYNIDSSVDSLDSINWETSSGVYEELD